MDKISGKFYFVDLPYTRGFFSISLLASSRWLKGMGWVNGGSDGKAEESRRLGSAHHCPGDSRRERSKHRATGARGQQTRKQQLEKSLKSKQENERVRGRIQPTALCAGATQVTTDKPQAGLTAL